jgi:hypothetical protein
VRLTLRMSRDDASAVLVLRHVPEPVGLVGPFVTALAVLLGLGRLHRAVWLNHRYRFTTWRWAKVAAWMMLFGFVMKAAIALAPA